MGTENSWFSVTGSKRLLGGLYRRLFLPDEEGARLHGKAVGEQGKGLQEVFKALDQRTAVEQNQVKLIKEKLAVLRELGMPEQALLVMAQREFSRLDGLASALDVLQRHIEQGTIIDARVEELPPATDEAESGP